MGLLRPSYDHTRFTMRVSQMKTLNIFYLACPWVDFSLGPHCMWSSGTFHKTTSFSKFSYVHSTLFWLFYQYVRMGFGIKSICFSIGVEFGIYVGAPTQRGWSSCVLLLVLSCVVCDCCWLAVCIVVVVYVLLSYVYLLYFFFFALDAGLLAISQYSEGPATGHLDTGFSWFPCA